MPRKRFLPRISTRSLSVPVREARLNLLHPYWTVRGESSLDDDSWSEGELERSFETKKRLRRRPTSAVSVEHSPQTIRRHRQSHGISVDPIPVRYYDYRRHFSDFDVDNEPAYREASFRRRYRKKSETPRKHSSQRKSFASEEDSEDDGALKNHFPMARKMLLNAETKSVKRKKSKKTVNLHINWNSRTFGMLTK